MTDRPRPRPACAAGLALALVCTSTQARPAVDPDAGIAPAACLSRHAGAARGAPRSRGALLARGINVTDLFEPADEPDLPGTFRRLRRAGIRNVRIPVSPEIFASVPPAWQASALRRLDQAVCDAIDADLGVVIDLHPFALLEPVGGPIEAIGAQLAVVWRRLAARYGNASPDLVLFEILNEPKLPDGQQWETVQRSLLHAIRSVAPGNTVIATASPWSTAAALSALTPVADRNVVYAFHFYTPMIFTHQAAAWGPTGFGSVHGLDFPAQPDNVEAVSRRADPVVTGVLADYAKGFSDSRPIGDEIERAASWGRLHHVLVTVTEFGVYDRAAPAASRAAWLSTVRQQLERRRIGWSVWEYKGGFGIDGDLRQGCAAPGSAPVSVPVSAATALDLCGS